MNKSTLYILPLSFFISTALQAGEKFDVNASLPNGTTMYSTSDTKVGKTNYKFVKYLNPKTKLIESVVLNEKGVTIKESDILEINPPLITDKLQSEMNQAKGLIKVNIALKVPLINIDTVPEILHADIRDGIATVKRNGEKVYKEDILKELDKKSALLLELDIKRRNKRTEIAQQLIERNNWNDKEEELESQLKNGLATLTLELKPSEIKKLGKNSIDLIDGIELYQKPETYISDAMLSSGINPHAIQHSSRRGNGVGIYVSEPGCPKQGFTNGYTEIIPSNEKDRIHWDHTRNVVGIARAVSPDSHIYCRHGYSLPTSGDLKGVDELPRVYVSNSSWGAPGHNYTTQDRNWDDFVYNDKILAFNSAGNAGVKRSQNKNESNKDYKYYLENRFKEVCSPAKGLNIVAVGNYNDEDDTIDPHSSYEDPQTKNQKPEIVAPGESIAAGGVTKSGTSMASPHAAGFAADLMSTYPWLRLSPALSKATLMAGATKNINVLSGDTDDTVGVGGIDFYRSVYNGTDSSWRGNNSDYFNKNEDIERKIKLYANQDVRIVIAWLNRGTYTYKHRTNAHPIGMDLDMTILDSKGNIVASSLSWDNPYEMVNFSPKKTGTYTVRIHRFANRDKKSVLNLGLSINWQ